MLFDMYLPFCPGFIFLPGSKTLIHLKSKRFRQRISRHFQALISICKYMLV